MFAWDSSSTLGRVRREQGCWGLMVTVGKKDASVIVKNETGTFPMKEEVKMPEQLGAVGVSCGTTINMKNYESARVDCWCSLPCAEGDMEATYNKCHEFVAARVHAESAKQIEKRDE